MSATMCTDWKMETLCDWYNGVDMGTGSMVVLYNNDFYNSMSPDDKELFDSMRQEAWIHCRDFMIQNDQNANKILKDAGKVIVMPSAEENAAWKDAVNTIILPKWKADAQSVGVSAETCDKILKDWQDIRAKYWKQYNMPGEP